MEIILQASLSRLYRFKHVVFSSCSPDGTTVTLESKNSAAKPPCARAPLPRISFFLPLSPEAHVIVGNIELSLDLNFRLLYIGRCQKGRELI